MIESLLGESRYYIFIFISLVFISGKELRPLTLGYLGLMIIDNSINPYIPEEHFFQIKALFDVGWIITGFFLLRSSLIQKQLMIVCSVSLLTNLYLCFDMSNNILYKYWNDINFLLFEVIVFIIASNSSLIKRFNNWLHKAAIDMTNK